MDEIEALNMLLRAIGSDPVTSVEADQPDVGNAMDTLNRHRKRAQNRGWWFNIQYNVTFPVDAGEIRIPKEYTLVVFEDTGLVKRGTRLFNKYTNSFQFTEDAIAVRTIYTLPWDELPNSMQEFIAYSAAASFVRDEIEDGDKELSFKQDAGIAGLDLKKEELEQGQYNSFNKSRVAYARAGVRPYARGF